MKTNYFFTFISFSHCLLLFELGLNNFSCIQLKLYLCGKLEFMRLSELKTGEKGVIIKVLGHGGFRKRIVEMGFIKGKTVEVLLNAPLKDPVKYKVMGYEISLRHQEADMIEVISEEEGGKSKERIQKFEGIVISRKGTGATETFTVRKVSSGVGVERTFPVNSPNIASIEVVKKGKVRRAKLYFLRTRESQYKIKERR